MCISFILYKYEQFKSHLILSGAPRKLVFDDHQHINMFAASLHVIPDIYVKCSVIEREVRRSKIAQTLSVYTQCTRHLCTGLTSWVQIDSVDRRGISDTVIM